MTGSLFGDDFATPDDKARADAPLAERLRPKSLDEIVGLADLLGAGRFLRENRWLVQTPTRPLGFLRELPDAAALATDLADLASKRKDAR